MLRAAGFGRPPPTTMTLDAQHESITAADLGLPPGARMPLRFSPGRVWSPVVISFPHVGLAWPHDLRPKPQVDFARNADFEVQTLYPEVNAFGAATVEAVYSRLVVDLNRAHDDVSAFVVPDHPAPRPRRRPGVVPADDGKPRDHGHRIDRPGRGVVWASAVGNVRILEGPLRFAEFKRRIDLFHEPYYRALEILLERRRRRHGYAILLDAHSMPGSVGVDLVLGTLDGTSCHPSIERIALDALRSGDAPLTVQLNDPYRGGEVVRRFGRPDQGIHALQLEINRRLYMDETTTTLWEHPTPSLLLPNHEATASPDPDGLRPMSRLEGSGWHGRPSTPWRRPPDEDVSPQAHRGMGNANVSGPQTLAGEHPGVLGRIATPPPRQARDLADLLARVTCLVRRLVLESSDLDSSADGARDSTADGSS
jgi:N-formylglutamate deformylase